MLGLRENRAQFALLVLIGEPMPLQPALSETRGLPRGPRRLCRQLRVQFRFKATNAFSHCRLRHAQLTCCGADASCLDYCHEILYLLEAQGYNLQVMVVILTASYAG